MAPKKTLSNWLTTRYLLIIRNEENFAEKKTVSFNYARVMLVLGLAFLITVLLSVYLVTVVLEQWLDPRYTVRQTNRQLVDLTVRLDSLEYELALREQYVQNIHRIIGGDTSFFEGLDEDRVRVDVNNADMEFRESIQPIDSQIRAEFEGQEMGVMSYTTSRPGDFQDLFLFSPLSGIVTDGFNPKLNHFGVDIVAKENEPVKCVADGVVILSSWTLDGGYVMGVQHRGNLVSVYKHNSDLFKNVGNFVSAGEIIAVIGNTGELTSGPHLHFELWHNGNPVNPVEYVAF